VLSSLRRRSSGQLTVAIAHRPARNSFWALIARIPAVGASGAPNEFYALTGTRQAHIEGPPPNQQWMGELGVTPWRQAAAGPNRIAYFLRQSWEMLRIVALGTVVARSEQSRVHAYVRVHSALCLR